MSVFQADLAPAGVRAPAPGLARTLAALTLFGVAFGYVEELLPSKDGPYTLEQAANETGLEVALIENMVREDLNPVDEARACAALVEELGLSHEEVGVRIGRSRAAVSNLLRLLDLPDQALELIERGALSEGHGRALLIAADHGARRRLARAAAERGWSVRELEARARGANEPATPRAAAMNNSSGTRLACVA